MWSWNPIAMIPDTIDKNIRDLIVSLIAIQFIAFLILMFHLTWEFIKYKQECKRIDKLSAEQREEEKRINENQEPIKFDNMEEEVKDGYDIVETSEVKENKIIEENSINEININKSKENNQSRLKKE